MKFMTVALLASATFSASAQMAEFTKDGLSVHWFVSKRLPDWLGIPQAPAELSKSSVTVCASSVNPGINSIEVTAVYRINGEERAASKFIKNSAKRGCKEIASEPTLAGDLELVDVIFDEQPITSTHRYSAKLR